MQRVSTLLFIALVTAPAYAETPEEAVRARAEGFARAWNAHDMKALARLFSEDAQFVNVMGTWWKSRDEIEAAHIATHKTMFKDSRLSGTVSTVKALQPEVMSVHYTWQLVGAKTPEGKTVPPRRGILLFVFTKSPEGWLIRVAQNTDIVQAAPTSAPTK